MRKSVIAAIASLAVIGVPVLAPTVGASAAPQGGSDQAWKAREYQRNGVDVSELSNGKVVVRVYGGGAGPVAPKVGHKEVTVEVVVPDVKRQDVPLSQKGPSVYDMSIASGMSPEEACEFAEGMDPFGCESAPAPAVARPAALGGTSMGIAPTPTGLIAPMSNSSDDFLGSICYDLVTYEGDGSKHAHGCNSRYHDAWSPSYRWIANKMKVTGWSKDPGWVHDRINGVGIQARYTASDSYATDWDPYTTETVGSCKTVTSSATSPKTGTSYSSSETVCPEKLTPWHSPEFQYFGAKWTGDAAPESERRGAVAASVHKIPRSQGYKANTYLWIRWN